MVVALVLGIGLAFLRDYLDYTVRSPEYMEEVLGLTPMAVVGVIGEGDGRGRGRSARHPEGSRATGIERTLVTLTYPHAPASESFRVLRTNIQFASVDHPVRSLIVTSAGPREGKSFTAANLAIVMAQAGRRVVLVDTDLRRPTLHKLFGLPNTRGFTTLLLNRGDDDIIQTHPEIPNLRIITSGPLPPNPSELLSTNQAVQVMDQLAQYADLVIYDTPPAAAVTDPTLLAARVDAVVLVINAGVTRRDVVRRVLRNLQNAGSHALIPILNQVKAGDVAGYYYYYSGYDRLPETVPATNGNGKHPATNGNGKHPATNGNGKHSPALSLPPTDDLPVPVQHGDEH
jgi:capsular exopolysaccharide synthesis family protein